MAFRVKEKYRLKKAGAYSSHESYGNNGMFRIPYRLRKSGRTIHLICIASDGFGWEHVSTSTLLNRTPTWDEMQFIKEQFWDDDDLVIQFHPPKSDYVNNHPYTLHLWRKFGTNDFCQRPPNFMV